MNNQQPNWVERGYGIFKLIEANDDPLNCKLSKYFFFHIFIILYYNMYIMINLLIIKSDVDRQMF